MSHAVDNWKRHAQEQKKYRRVGVKIVRRLMFTRTHKTPTAHASMHTITHALNPKPMHACARARVCVLIRFRVRACALAHRIYL